MVANRERFTPEQYLEWEQYQELKYEYVNGEIFAMTGGTIAHATISLNIASALKSHLRGSRCRTFMSDVKVGISAQGSFHYPDVMVSCDERDAQATQMIQYPCLIVEVLSPTTEAYDRGGKFAHYRQLNTLQEYVLVEAQRVGVECFRRNIEGKWVLNPYTEGEVHLTSVDFRCSISLLYEDVQFNL